jgi:hypothetical protein
MDKVQYLDLDGLNKYDELIKSYIVLGDESLSSAYKSADADLEISIKGYIDERVDLKQNVIEDLETIRSGAAAGATALQAVPAEYVTETELAGMGYLTANDLVFAEDGDINNLFNKI